MYNFPVFATRGGGLCRPAGLCAYIFIEDPNCPGLSVGSYVPEDWGIEPVNELARNYIDVGELGVGL